MEDRNQLPPPPPIYPVTSDIPPQSPYHYSPAPSNRTNRGILGGLDLAEYYPELGPALLVCATETKTTADIESYVAALGEVMQSVRAA